MEIKKLIDEIFADVVRGFTDDGMRVMMPKDVEAELKGEMTSRLCDAINELRDDIEMDVRAFTREDSNNDTCLTIAELHAIRATLPLNDTTRDVLAKIDVMIEELRAVR